MPATLQHAGGYEWRIEETQLLIPQPRAGENAVRVVYRAEGARVFRRFLLLVDDAVPLSNELVMRSIAEHAAR